MDQNLIERIARHADIDTRRAMVFGTRDFMTSRSYLFRRDDGLVSLYALLKMEHSRHPDFNEDGSFKRAQIGTG